MERKHKKFSRLPASVLNLSNQLLDGKLDYYKKSTFPFDYVSYFGESLGDPSVEPNLFMENSSFLKKGVLVNFCYTGSWWASVNNENSVFRAYCFSEAIKELIKTVQKYEI